MSNPTPQDPAGPTTAAPAPGEAATTLNPQPAASTALAKVASPLSPARKEEVYLRQQQAARAGEIARLSWGKDLEEYTRMALAAWGFEHNVDVVTEVDMLGGHPYLNSRYYIRRLSDLIGLGLVDYVDEPDFVHVEPRLDKLVLEGDGWAVAEVARRAQVRIERGIPDAATGACVFRVKLHALSKPTIGVNWCGGGTGAHKANGKGDPVGDKEPIKTSESRAARRCIRLLVSHIPEQAKEIEAVVKSLDAFKPETTKQLNAPTGRRPEVGVHTGGYEKPTRTLATGAVPVEVIDSTPRPATARFAGQPDPYLEKPPEPTPEPTDEELDRELLERERAQ